jgi:hypothetical protein
MRTNKCCENNSIVIIDGWSGLCRKCGRFHYDEMSYQLSVKDTKKKLAKNYTEYLGMGKVKNLNRHCPTY